MSLVLQSSGGGQITIQEPATASNFTVTLPAASGEVMVSGNQPAFSAYRSTSQTGIASNTFTKVQLNLEDFDTSNAFDATTNYRFQPQVAGYYQFNWSVYLSVVGLSLATSLIYKNGTVYKYGNLASGTIGDVITVGSELIYMNGSSDYVELYAFGSVASGTITLAVSGNATIRFSGLLVRGA